MVIWRSFFQGCRGGRRYLLDGRYAVLGCDEWYGQNIRRSYSTGPVCPSGLKVTICGAAGCTGQPLALLLKQCPLLDELALYDQCATCCYAMELSHVDTRCRISSYSGKHMLCDALKDAKVVVIVARNTHDTFEFSAPIMTEIALQICNTCPGAFTLVATQPVESLVPLVGEIQRLRGAYNPRVLMGCVELNCVRANTVLADFLKVPPEAVKVPVIGGATPTTMVPVLSAAVHPCTITQKQIECVTSCIMSGNEAVCAAKGCTSATACLAGAYAIARNTINVLKGIQGKRTTQCAYVDSLGTCAPNCQYFASEVVLGPSGIEKNLGVPELTKFEHCLLCTSLPYIRNEIARGIWLVKQGNVSAVQRPGDDSSLDKASSQTQETIRMASKTKTVYTMCQQCCCPTCCWHPSTCSPPPICPCVPPTNWSCGCPDACRDEYLASICREMTCRCGSTELCWRPRENDYDAGRAANITHQIPPHIPSCGAQLPRSVRITQEILDKAKNPCCKFR